MPGAESLRRWQRWRVGSASVVLPRCEGGRGARRCGMEGVGWRGSHALPSTPFPWRQWGVFSVEGGGRKFGRLRRGEALDGRKFGGPSGGELGTVSYTSMLGTVILCGRHPVSCARRLPWALRVCLLLGAHIEMYKYFVSEPEKDAVVHVDQRRLYDPYSVVPTP